MATKYFCDKCQSELRAEETKIVDLRAIEVVIDLCPTCRRELKRLVLDWREGK